MKLYPTHLFTPSPRREIQSLQLTCCCVYKEWRVKLNFSFSRALHRRGRENKIVFPRKTKTSFLGFIYFPGHLRTSTAGVCHIIILQLVNPVSSTRFLCTFWFASDKFMSVVLVVLLATRRRGYKKHTWIRILAVAESKVNRVALRIVRNIVGVNEINKT